MKKKSFLARLFLSATLFAPIGANAQVTIGSNAAPQATLDIIGSPNEIGRAFRLIDGNESAGKVLTVGENGIGTWRYAALHRIAGVKPPAENIQPSLRFPLAVEAGRIGNGTFKQTGASITLPPGKWEVTVKTLIAIVDVSTNPPQQHDLTANDFAWVRSTFTDSPTAEGPNIESPDILTTHGGSLISGRVSGPKPSIGTSRICWGMISGVVVIHNQSGADKTYYYVAGAIDTNSNFTEEQVVVVIRANGLESSITAVPIL